MNNASLSFCGGGYIAPEKSSAKGRKVAKERSKPRIKLCYDNFRGLQINKRKYRKYQLLAIIHSSTFSYTTPFRQAKDLHCLELVSKTSAKQFLGCLVGRALRLIVCGDGSLLFLNISSQTKIDIAELSILIVTLASEDHRTLFALFVGLGIEVRHPRLAVDLLGTMLEAGARPL